MRGATAPGATRQNGSSYFNPRTLEVKICVKNISIHAPHAGCDGRARRLPYSPQAFQSTHPMRGATRSQIGDLDLVGNFNPRTPCGVRQGFLRNQSRRREFQSTHPMRGATDKSFGSSFCPFRFQSTHPMRGATFFSPSYRHSPILFQSTHPMRGATAR